MTARLKSLELHGYKTFASRILFEFPGDVTAVVGPNGSGKSNIADAIRWVLGEQSYSLLRGRKTEDMIFSGSEGRPRAGMASASIVFDNSDGWLPIDFAEVSITRRAYRDGQNEYLLNGQRVRLKEIGELLAQSGLAERTYTMIGQGLVDAALALKPEERRRFFEEAAGIGLYRTRKEESINRLDSTRRNLERVSDILNELEPRLISLEKQAKRVVEYERIKADLRLLLREWYGYHWHRSQADMVHANDVVRAQETRVVAARSRVEEIETDMGELRTRIQELRARLSQWHAQQSDLQHQREKITRDLAVMDERQRALREQHTNLQGDLARLEEEHATRQERMETAEKERAALESEVNDARQQAAVAGKNLQARQVEREQVDRLLREVRRSLVNAETRQVQVRAHQNELGNRLETLRKSRTSLSQALEADSQGLEGARARLEEADQVRKRTQAEAGKIDDEIEILRKQIGEGETQRKRLQDERARLEAERSRQKAQLEVLVQAERSMSGLNQGARFLMQASRQGKLSGELRALSSALVVPAEYERAVAAVLGEALDSLVLGKDSDLDAALGMLEEGEKGRAVLLAQPLGSNKNEIEALSGMQNDPDFIGLAADLVQIPEDVRGAARILLGQVLVVRGRDAARRAAAQLPPTARAVTLRGEVFWGNGMVVAGQDGRSGVIARPRQIAELEAGLEKLAGQLKELAAQQEAHENDLTGLRQRQNGLEKTQREHAQRISAAGQAFQQANLALEQARQRNEWQKSQLLQVERQLHGAEEEAKKGAGELKQTEEEITRANEQVRQHNRALSALPLDDLQAQVVHWNTTRAVAERALQEAARRLEEQTQALAANTNLQASLRQRVDSAAAAATLLDGEKESLGEQEARLAGQVEALRAQVDPAETELESLEVEMARRQETLSSAQQTLTLGERLFAQAQLEASRQHEALDSLRRRIEDDFGLVALEYTEVPGQTPLPFGDMVEQLPVVKEINPQIEESITRQRGQLRRMGAINLEAHKEYTEVKERYEFLSSQVEDLKQADADLRQVITELDELMRREFLKTFEAVASEFKQMFTRLFGGGSARLVLADEENPTEGGVDIEARLPGRREQGLSLLSGGERSLTAVALIFSLLKVSPTPFCVMDEVDAMLDEANVGRFRDLLLELSEKTQFIVITHNRNTVQAADVIYGVTMGRDSTSQIISLRMDEVSEDMAK